MELRHLRYFCALADELHFRRAAAQLHIAQPALSEQIRKLETELGVRLLDRDRRRVTLSPAGAAFLREARTALDHAERAAEAARRAARGEIGQLRIGLTNSAAHEALPAIVPAFRAAYPDVGLVLRDLSIGEQMPLLLAGEIDLGFVRPRPHEPGLRCETVTRETFVAVLPSGHRLADGGEIEAGELAGEPFVLWPRQRSPELYDRLLGYCRDAGFVPTIAQEANEIPTILGLVAAGLGVSLLAESVRALHRDGVALRPLRPRLPGVDLVVAWNPAHASPLIDRFLAVVRERAPAATGSAPPAAPRRRPSRSR
jgi:DNA-binding transcriptional LysR family regulator